MLATEISTDLHSSPTLQAEPLEAGSSVTTVKVYTRHNRGCAKRDRPDWARCNCVKWLYVYRNGKNTLTSARTRSWERLPLNGIFHTLFRSFPVYSEYFRQTQI
jgi:hypothetical protein